MFDPRNLITASLLLGGIAGAAQADSFGDAHVVALSSDANASIHYVSVSPGSASSTSFVLVPAADIFVADRVSIGGFGLVSSTSATTAPMTDTTITTLGLGGRVGYAIALGERFSLWPKVGVSAVRASSGGASDSHLALAANARVLYHPAQHFFVGFGPDLNVDLTGDVRTTTAGASFTLGGWL